MFAFLSIFSITSANKATGIPVTIYSALEFSDRDVIVNVFFPGDITWSVSMMSNFETASMTELGSKTGYHTLTSLKMSSHLLIQWTCS